jgi:hypothetical protein
MNTFFFFNCGFSLLIFFIPYYRLELSPHDSIDSILKLIGFILIVGLVFLRGRYAVQIKGHYLYCNDYPFYKRFELSNVSTVSIENKRVTVTLKDKSVHEVTYFFGIESAIDQKVLNMLINAKGNF